MQCTGNDASPPGLVACPQSGTVVAVEILVELNVITPMGILLKFLYTPIHRPSTVLPLPEDVGQAARDFLGDLIEVHLSAGVGRALDGKIIAVVGVVLEKGADNQSIDGHPDRAAPVRVAPKHARVRFAGQIRNSKFLLPDAPHVGMFRMVAR